MDLLPDLQSFVTWRGATFLVRVWENRSNYWLIFHRPASWAFHLWVARKVLLFEGFCRSSRIDLGCVEHWHPSMSSRRLRYSIDQDYWSVLVCSSTMNVVLRRPIDLDFAGGRDCSMLAWKNSEEVVFQCWLYFDWLRFDTSYSRRSTLTANDRDRVATWTDLKSSREGKGEISGWFYWIATDEMTKNRACPILLIVASSIHRCRSMFYSVETRGLTLTSIIKVQKRGRKKMWLLSQSMSWIFLLTHEEHVITNGYATLSRTDQHVLSSVVRYLLDIKHVCFEWGWRLGVSAHHTSNKYGKSISSILVQRNVFIDLRKGTQWCRQSARPSTV